MILIAVSVTWQAALYQATHTFSRHSYCSSDLSSDYNLSVQENSALNPQNIEIILKSVLLTSVCYIIFLVLLIPYNGTW